MSPKSKFPLGSQSAKKSIGKLLTFYDRGGKQKVRLYNKPTKPASAAQAVQRGLIRDKVAIWQAFSDEDKAVWAAEAKTLGDPWSGYTLFMSTYTGEEEVSHDLFSATHSDTVPASPVSGDVIFSNDTPKWTRLPKGDDDKILTLKSGLPSWEPAAGAAFDPTEMWVKIFDSDFDNLALGDIDGKGSYDYAGAWVNNSGVDCSAEIVVDPGGGQMLRLDDASIANMAAAYIDLAVGSEVLTGIVEVKVKVSDLGLDARGNFFIMDKTLGKLQGAYFTGASDDIYYRSASGSHGKLVDAIVDTWYVVRWYFCRLANHGVWWVDGVFIQSRVALQAGDKFDRLYFYTRDIYSGNTFDIKYVKVWNLNYV